MSEDKWWIKPKDHEQKASDGIQKAAFRKERDEAREVVRADNNSPIGDMRLQARERSRDYWDKQIAEGIEKKRGLDALKDKEVRERTGAGSPNPFGFFTSQTFTRDNFTPKDRLHMAPRKDQDRDRDPDR